MRIIRHVERVDNHLTTQGGYVFQMRPQTEEVWHEIIETNEPGPNENYCSYCGARPE